MCGNVRQEPRHSISGSFGALFALQRNRDTSGMQYSVVKDRMVSGTIGQASAFGLIPLRAKIVNYLVEHEKIDVSGALKILAITRWYTVRGLLVDLEKRGVLDYITSGKQRDAHSHYRLANGNG